MANSDNREPARNANKGRYRISYIEAIGGDAERMHSYDFTSAALESMTISFSVDGNTAWRTRGSWLLESFGFDYDAASDLDVAKHIHKLVSEEELD
ncbi:MAG: hypothetical protein ACLTRS_09905 [Lachnospiraceae bacterium]